jgi:hypothetical protein
MHTIESHAGYSLVSIQFQAEILSINMTHCNSESPSLSIELHLEADEAYKQTNSSNLLVDAETKLNPPRSRYHDFCVCRHSLILWRRTTNDHVAVRVRIEINQRPAAVQELRAMVISTIPECCVMCLCRGSRVEVRIWEGYRPL